MNRARGYQAGANAATLANAVLGVGAIGYTLAGNKLFALLLVVGAIGFDGLDGLLHRRGGGPPTLTGRILDSSADAISFGIAPGFLLAVHTYAAQSFGPYATVALLVGIEVAVLALVRLVYFTLRSYARPYFLGASTPQTTLALVALVLLFDQPGFLGSEPILLLGVAALLAPLMVAPIPFPKIRRGASLRWLMTATSVALALALVPAQFVPARGSAIFLVSEAATWAATFGVAVYYILGPWSARLDERKVAEGTPHA
ncbi:MAG TPA: CDP-alcohol phosphatidyltransferase family protein [Thermoplasmata archaeon]|nr:CDP-alcohol phosphatidyltransferase family protein [Thermoplasmata archaeon]